MTNFVIEPFFEKKSQFFYVIFLKALLRHFGDPYVPISEKKLLKKLILDIEKSRNQHTLKTPRLPPLL